MTIRVGVNGFGRIGRDVVRGILLREDLPFELVSINASGDWNMMAHLFKYDTIYRQYPGDIKVVEKGFEIDGNEIVITDQRDAEQIPWEELGVDIVIDTTGAFTKREGAEKHLKAGAKKVVITSPATDEDITIVMGVNDKDYDPENHNIISNASCTTNCLAPVAKVVMDNFGIERGLMTTVHAYTNDQNIHDAKHKKDYRRARAGAENIIPTSTGAAKAVALVLPELKGKLTGYALRVPVPTGSVVDVTFELSKDATVEEINAAMKEAAEGPMKGVLSYTEDPIVSSDIIADNHSSIFDSKLTLVQDRMVKLVSWYDNEWGYSQRVVDLTALVASKM
ncbi:type I glyceraldehyde-3-phosphate dehydrogenase [Peptoniphilus sp. KCTC 25270]|uniref:type I glyceraldehyde-3-phosphate dehydrogenase n=1 Tax=Peptoniphilus sp. KCTC 25270 TaxID=2897414 RepID=UPI001E34579B|nr:type I glyceraldehyde-3-phosphate dehydrogenase [Peptoniphilus sp. KCTC 25270]MCD1147402.1 type I glyceraldehyde-3-phosphate dehydrogenase [Peptoniphilus sp. KCTC 25270]